MQVRAYWFMCHGHLQYFRADARECTAEMLLFVLGRCLIRHTKDRVLTSADALPRVAEEFVAGAAFQTQTFLLVLEHSSLDR